MTTSVPESLVAETIKTHAARIPVNLELPKNCPEANNRIQFAIATITPEWNKIPNILNDNRGVLKLRIRNTRDTNRIGNPCRD